MGIAAENIMLISKHIAVEMIDTSPYIQAVLGTN
jgi:multicomponent Na+:H+ antiporter subunit D